MDDQLQQNGPTQPDPSATAQSEQPAPVNPSLEGGTTLAPGVSASPQDPGVADGPPSDQVASQTPPSTLAGPKRNNLPIIVAGIVGVVILAFAVLIVL